MSSAPNGGTGRTIWDVLIELVHNRKALLWAAIITWVLVAGAVLAVKLGYVHVTFSRLGSKPLSCTDYAIRISSSLPESVSPPSFSVSGYSKPLPEGFELWLFTTEKPGYSEQYWPRDPYRIVGKGPDLEEWQVEVSLSLDSWKSGAIKHYRVFMVGRNGQALIRFYKQTMTALNPSPRWPPLTETTSDMVKCDAMYQVKLKLQGPGLGCTFPPFLFLPQRLPFSLVQVGTFLQEGASVETWLRFTIASAGFRSFRLQTPFTRGIDLFKSEMAVCLRKWIGS